jgi:hypothetical protein
MDIVQKHNGCTNVPSSQTFRSYLYNQYGPGISPNFRKFERLKIQLAKTSNHLTFLISRFLPEDGDRVQSPKRCVLKHRLDGKN